MLPTVEIGIDVGDVGVLFQKEWEANIGAIGGTK